MDHNASSSLHKGSHLVIQLRERRLAWPRSMILAEASVSFQNAQKLFSTVADLHQGLHSTIPSPTWVVVTACDLFQRMEPGCFSLWQKAHLEQGIMCDFRLLTWENLNVGEGRRCCERLASSRKSVFSGRIAVMSLVFGIRQSTMSAPSRLMGFDCARTRRPRG